MTDRGGSRGGRRSAALLTEYSSKVLSFGKLGLQRSPCHLVFDGDSTHLLPRWDVGRRHWSSHSDMEFFVGYICGFFVCLFCLCICPREARPELINSVPNCELPPWLTALA